MSEFVPTMRVEEQLADRNENSFVMKNVFQSHETISMPAFPQYAISNKLLICSSYRFSCETELTILAVGSSQAEIIQSSIMCEEKNRHYWNKVVNLSVKNPKIYRRRPGSLHLLIPPFRINTTNSI